MTRREGIIGALMLGAGKSVNAFPQNFGVSDNKIVLNRLVALELIQTEQVKDDMTVLAISVKTKDGVVPAPAYGVILRYNGREAKVTMDEIMDALGAVAIRDGAPK